MWNSAIPHSYRVAVATEDESNANVANNNNNNNAASTATAMTSMENVATNMDAALANVEMFAKKSFQKVEQVTFFSFLKKTRRRNKREI